MVDTDDTRPTGEPIKNTGLQFQSTNVPSSTIVLAEYVNYAVFWWAIIGDLYENDNFLLIYCHCG